MQSTKLADCRGGFETRPYKSRLGRGTKTWMRGTNPRIKSGDGHDGESSIQSQVKVRDHLGPAIGLVVDEGRELLRRAAHGIVAGARGFFSQRGVGENARDLGVELG